MVENRVRWRLARTMPIVYLSMERFLFTFLFILNMFQTAHTPIYGQAPHVAATQTQPRIELFLYRREYDQLDVVDYRHDTV